MSTGDNDGSVDQLDDLLRRWLSGDDEAVSDLARLLGQYVSQAKKWIFPRNHEARKGGRETGDLESELWRRLSPLRTDSSKKFVAFPVAYITQMLRNIVNDWVRHDSAKRRGGDKKSCSWPTSDDSSPENLVPTAGGPSHADKIELFAAIDRLPENEKTIILWRYVLDPASSFEKLGCALGYPETTARNLHNRALLNLKRLLGGGSDDTR